MPSSPPVGRAAGDCSRAVRTTPMLPSVLTAISALLIHPSAGAAVSQPISFELQRGNPFAFAVLVGLAWAMWLVAAQFARRGHWLSVAACGLCVVLLVVIPCTDPRSACHLLAYGGLVVVALGLFLVWALDTFDVVQVLPPFLPVALGLPFWSQLGVGGFQLLLIASLLVALNLTCRHLANG